MNQKYPRADARKGYPFRCRGLAGGFLVASDRDRHLYRPPYAPGFGALIGSAASEGVFASSLDVR
jgi:hypothetical protein